MWMDLEFIFEAERVCIAIRECGVLLNGIADHLSFKKAKAPNSSTACRNLRLSSYVRFAGARKWEAAFRLLAISEAVSAQFESLCKTRAARALPATAITVEHAAVSFWQGKFYVAEFLNLGGLLLLKSSPVIAMDPHSLLAMCGLWQGGMLWAVWLAGSLFGQNFCT